VSVPAGSRGVFDGSGELVHVVRPDGVTFERDLTHQWSGPRAKKGELVVTKVRRLLTELTLKGANGNTTTLPRGVYEVVHDHATGEPVPVAYQQVKDGFLKWLKEPRTFLPDGAGGWAETQAGADAPTYQAWLASANQATAAARTLYRTASLLPKLRADPSAIKDLLHHGTGDDQMAAIYVAVLMAKDGVPLRWHQVSAWHEFADGKFVNMPAGEGKTWVYLVHAVRQALRSDVDAVHYITTRTQLANRDFKAWNEMLTPLGIKVHRMNHQKPPPEPAPGEPTIEVGITHDVAFTYLGEKRVPGQKTADDSIHAIVDEVDEALVYSKNLFILSNGVTRKAPPRSPGS